MDKKKKLIVIVLVFALLIAGASVLYKNLGETYAPEQLAVAETEPVEQNTTEFAEENTTAPAEESNVEPPKIAAPDFTVYDAEGNPVKLSDYFGKPIILNFWASWCGPCKKEMPDFNEKSQELEGEVQFLMINMTDGFRETMETATAFIEEQGYTFPVFFDTRFEAAYTYGAYSLPTTFFIDAQGYVITQATGAISMETLQRGIDMIYKS